MRSTTFNAGESSLSFMTALDRKPACSIPSVYQTIIQICDLSDKVYEIFCLCPYVFLLKIQMYKNWKE